MWKKGESLVFITWWSIFVPCHVEGKESFKRCANISLKSAEKRPGTSGNRLRGYFFLILGIITDAITSRVAVNAA